MAASTAMAYSTTLLQRWLYLAAGLRLLSGASCPSKRDARTSASHRRASLRGRERVPRGQRCVTKERNAMRVHVGCELTVRSIGTIHEVYVGLFQLEKFRTNLFPLATNQGARRITRRCVWNRAVAADVLTTCVR